MICNRLPKKRENRYNSELFDKIKYFTDIDVIKQFFNIITLNNKQIADMFNKKNNKKEWTTSVWEYPMVLASKVDELISTGDMQPSEKLDLKRIDTIFADVFAIMDTIKVKLQNDGRFIDTSGIEITDFGNIPLFNIGNTHTSELKHFFQLYEINKTNYLQLPKI